MKAKDLKAIANALNDDAEVMIRNHHGEVVPVKNTEIKIMDIMKSLTNVPYLAVIFEEEQA